MQSIKHKLIGLLIILFLAPAVNSFLEDPNLILWLDAYSLTQENNTAVTTWADNSTFGNDATATTYAPIYRSAGWGDGRPTVFFNGGDYYASILNIAPTTSPLTIFSVFKTHSAGEADGSLFTISTNVHGSYIPRYSGTRYIGVSDSSTISAPNEVLTHGEYHGF